MADPTVPTIAAARWRELQGALHCVNMADFEVSRGNADDGRIWLDDARRAIGSVALLLSDDPAAEGHAALLGLLLGGPTDARP